MHAKIENVRTNVPLGILWKWTGVSAFIHGVIIAALCGISFLGHQKRDAVAKAKAATEEAAAKAIEAEAAKAAKTEANPATAANPADPNKPAAAKNPAPKDPAADPAKPPVSAENVLGIDKVAKPDEIPKSPFSTKGDDLLKDLK